MEGFQSEEQDERLDYGSKKIGLTSRLQKGGGMKKLI